ncbi:MAG TPA: toxin-antitoxin system HicB family antitoxin [Dermatophilaceae bacterium]|nr:toxin-antitoxin system HicB family antitoxin [Dermatophilaceae bacterium]
MIRFPEELHKELQAAAGERDLSLNALVIRLCEYGLPQLRPVLPSSLFVDEEPAAHFDSPADNTGDET